MQDICFRIGEVNNKMLLNVLYTSEQYADSRANSDVYVH